MLSNRIDQGCENNVAQVAELDGSTFYYGTRPVMSGTTGSLGEITLSPGPAWSLLPLRGGSVPKFAVAAVARERRIAHERGLAISCEMNRPIVGSTA